MTLDASGLFWDIPDAFGRLRTLFSMTFSEILITAEFLTGFYGLLRHFRWQSSRLRVTLKYSGEYSEAGDMSCRLFSADAFNM